MSAHRPHRITRRTAELLLRGERGQWGAGVDAVAGLLADAAAPAREAELAGQPAALAAFRSARLDPAPKPRRRSLIRSRLVASLATKTVAATVIAVAFGGVATAAVTGHLPGPGPRVAPVDRPTTTPAHSSTVDPHTADRATPTATAGHGRSPSPDLVGLCHAYTAGGGALNSPAFTALINTAGGPAKVPAYCATLVHDGHGRSDSAGTPTKHQGKAPHPTPRSPRTNGEGSHSRH